MNWTECKEIVLDSLKDSAIAFVFIFAIYLILALFEVRISKRLTKKSRLSPLFGSLFALVPQCGVSVIASDLYIKDHLTTGTLVAVFLSCSDEAIPLLLAGHSRRSLAVIPLILLKLIIGFLVGWIVDSRIKDKAQVEEHLHPCQHEEEVHVGCCHHAIDDEKESRFSKYFLHPLIHSLKIFFYLLIINLIFGLCIGAVGEDNLMRFVQANRYLAPLLSVLIGLIPHCASSVVLSELYLLGGLSFGALLGGLLMNSGLGLIYLLKQKGRRKEAMKIVAICLVSSLVFAYLTCLISGF